MEVSYAARLLHDVVDVVLHAQVLEVNVQVAHAVLAKVATILFDLHAGPTYVVAQRVERAVRAGAARAPEALLAA